MGILVVPPHADVSFVLSKAIVQALQQAGDDPETPAKAYAVLFEDHWFPLVIKKVEEDMQVWVDPPSAHLLQHCMQAAFEDHPIELHTSDIGHAFVNDCGFQTLGWILSLLSGDETSVPLSEQQACQWRALFHRHLVQNDIDHLMIRSPLTMGGTTQIKDDLATLVHQHGVKQSRAQSCATELLQALGVTTVQQILRAPRPWADLKARANAHTPQLRIVQSDELKVMIEQRAKQPKSVGSKQNKQHKAADEQLQLTPDKLMVPAGVFKQEGGQLVEQLQISQLGPQSSGVIIAQSHEEIGRAHV